MDSKKSLRRTGTTGGPIRHKRSSIDTILVTDDSSSCLLVAEAYLKEATNAKILFANNSREALELLKIETVDLIILNIKMPEVGGLVVAREAEAMGIPVIFLTASSKQQHGKELEEINYLYYLMKPITRQEFQAALAKAGVVNKNIHA